MLRIYRGTDRVGVGFYFSLRARIMCPVVGFGPCMRMASSNMSARVFGVVPFWHPTSSF